MIVSLHGLEHLEDTTIHDTLLCISFSIFFPGASKRNFSYFMYVGTFARVKSLFVDDMTLYIQMLNGSMYGYDIVFC